MKRKFKTRRKIRKKRKILTLFFIILVLISLCYVSRIRFITSNTNLINTILKDMNNYSNKDNNKLEEIYNYIAEKAFNSPLSILNLGLNYEKNEEKKQIELVYKEKTKPLVYIYNSHQGENYNYKYLEEYNIIPNVLMASLMLKDKLEDNNIAAIVEESDILAYMDQYNLDHSGSYIASRYFLEIAKEKYKDIDLYIDLHRDAISHSASTITMDGKDYAKVLFVIGLENPNYEYNLNLVTQLNNLILKKHPSLTRGIMKKQGYGVNGVYNQDFDPNVILIEIGGHENNIDEVNNTLDLIANVIGEYLNEKK